MRRWARPAGELYKVPSPFQRPVDKPQEGRGDPAPTIRENGGSLGFRRGAVPAPSLQPRLSTILAKGEGDPAARLRVGPSGPPQHQRRWLGFDEVRELPAELLDGNAGGRR